MEKNKFLLIVIIMSNLVSAQNSSNISGLYNLGSYSPEGGSHLFVLENGNYAITYFGGVQTGKWEIAKKNMYTFTPNIRESKFELFGRHNKDLKDETKICFSGFENGETFIQLRTVKEEEYTMQRVFNIDANCFSFPYVYTFKTIANSISFKSIQYNDDDTDHPIITIKNSEGYNDFFANFIEIDSFEGQPFFATFKDNKLNFEENDSIERVPFNKDNEEIEFIKNIIEMEANRDSIYLNPSYNTFGQFADDDEDQQDINEHHVFNKQKNAFVDTEYYVEGEEYTNSDDSFENMSIIYAYNILKEYTKKPVKYKINEKSLFQANCD